MAEPADDRFERARDRALDDGQADAIGQAGGGPVLGLIGNVWGISDGAGGRVPLRSLPRSGLYARAIRHGGDEPELEELPAPAA